MQILTRKIYIDLSLRNIVLSLFLPVINSPGSRYKSLIISITLIS